MGDRNENRWIDEDWRRDWLFWLGAVLARANVVLSAVAVDRPWWRLVLAWPLTFGFTVGIVGFVRTAWRAYRAP